MALTEQKVSTWSIVPALGTVAAEVFVGVTGALVAAGAKPAGVNDYAVIAGDDQLINTFGVVRVLSGAAVAAGAEIEVDIAGKAITLAAGIVCGMAFTAATGANQVINVRIPV